MTFTVELPQALCRQHSLPFRTLSTGTATSDEDYVHIPGVAPYIPPFVTEWGFEVVVYDDRVDEGDETVDVRFGLAHSGFLRDAYATGTIIDDDDGVLSVSDVDVDVDEGGVASFIFGLDRPVGQDVTVDYATADGSAAADEDYQAVSGTALIPAGELSVSVRVRTIQDLLDEHDETFELQLRNATVVSLDPGADAAEARIVDDDDPPAARVSNPSADEGGQLVFAVTLDAPSGREASVSYTTRDGAATAGDDYDYKAGGLDFAAGETAMTVSVQSLTDGETEGDEHFFLDLSGTDLQYDKQTGTGIIRDVTLRRVSVSDAVWARAGC